MTLSETKLKIKLNIPSERSTMNSNELELVITPKKEFLQWFVNIKGTIGETELDQERKKLNPMVCPNCKSQMKKYKINNDSEELWHICSKCNISFTQRQHNYFTKMIKRLIDENTNTVLLDE